MEGLLLKILEDEYNLQGAAVQRLHSFENRNFLVDHMGSKFILKEYEGEHRDRILSEISIMDRLARKFPGKIQETLVNSGGHLLTPTANGKFYRLLSYLEGELLCDTEHSHDMFRQVGRLLAGIDNELTSMKDPVLKAFDFHWDQDKPEKALSHSRYIKDPARKKLVDYFAQQFDALVRPKLPFFRKGFIYGDANDRNILVSEGRISGLIDFGDMHHASLIHDLAIALAYAMIGKDDPVAWARSMISGYCSVLPLDEDEVASLYYLIALRLCISACGSARARVEEPGDDYLTIHEEGVWSLLEQWVRISPIYAGEEFLKAAGHEFCFLEDVSVDIQRRGKFLSKSLSLSYQRPIKMRKAAFQYMYDHAGHTYLDCRNNIPHVGHSHPAVAHAARMTQLRLNTNTRYLYDLLNDYSERLLSRFPDVLNKVFFVNSGSAATDLAIRLANAYSGKKRWLVMEQGYHGNTKAGIDISHYKFGNKGGSGTPDHVLVAPMPDLYRREMSHKSKDLPGTLLGEELMRTIVPHQGDIAAFIAEPDIGCGGQVPLPPGYLDVIYPFIRSQGGVCIMDEVQTGFGRLGDHFWGFEKLAVVPDIVILGKPIGNGHPMGAVVCTEAVCAAFETGMEFFSSFGGNPVSCAIGMAVLDVMEREGLQDNALQTGRYFIDELHELQIRFPLMGDVRGSGFYLGIDMVKDPATRVPNTDLARQVCEGLRDRFILTGTDGPYENVLKIKPPLCFSRTNVDEFIEKMADTLSSLGSA